MNKLNTPDWRTLTPGKPDSDLYTEQAGHNEGDLTWWDGRNIGGATIGLIQFRANLPMMPGNMGNVTTFDFSLLYREMNADSIFDIMADQPTENFTAAAIEAGKWLELQGVRVIMGCEDGPEFSGAIMANTGRYNPVKVEAEIVSVAGVGLHNVDELDLYRLCS